MYFSVVDYQLILPVRTAVAKKIQQTAVRSHSLDVAIKHTMVSRVRALLTECVSVPRNTAFVRFYKIYI